MNNTVLKTFLWSVVLNLAGILTGAVPVFFLNANSSLSWIILFLIFALLSFLVQLLVALTYLASPSAQKKEQGQGMLLAIGLFLLIGFAICSPAWS